MAITVDPSQVHSITVDPSQVQAAPPEGRTLAGFAGNVVKSGGEFLGNTAGAIMHPLNTLKMLADIPIGIAEKVTGADLEPDSPVKSHQMIDALVVHFKERYGSLEGVKKALYEDPVGVAADVSTLFGGASGVLKGAGTLAKLGGAASVAGEAGEAAAVLAKISHFTNPAAPIEMALAKGIRVAPRILSRNSKVADAVEWGKNEAGIDVPAGVATGNKFVQGAQALLDHSPAGSIIADQANAKMASQFTLAAADLADQVHPEPVTPLQAGSEITTKLESKISGHHEDANEAYGNLREIEADPANSRNVQVGWKEIPAKDPATGQEIPGKTNRVPDMEDVQLPADTRPAAEALRPIYNQIIRQMPITQQRGSAGLLAIENIINAPHHVPASQLDADLSAIKAAARGADLPQLRTFSQGLAAKAVDLIHDAVSEAVGKAERTATDPAVLTAADEFGDTVSQPAIGGKTNASEANPAAVPVPEGQEGRAADTGAAQQSAVAQEPHRANAEGTGSEETIVKVPGEDTQYHARYEVRDISDLQPSHNGQTFQPNTRYAIRNDRSYANQANQEKIVSWSTPKEFDPAYHITDNPDATNGPPLIDLKGTVLGGNGRAMILDRVYAGNPKGAAAYRQMLTERAERFGIDPAEVAKVKNPVLVRVIDDTHLDSPAAYQDAVTNFNKSGTAALTPAEQAISDSRRVSPETLDHVAQRMSSLGADATLAQAIEGTHGGQLLQKLVEDGVISPQAKAGLVNDGVLTTAGKQRVSQLMLGRYFEDPEQLDSIAPSIRNKVERLAAPLAKLEAEPGFSLTPQVREAIGLLYQKAAHGAATLDDFLNQQGMFVEQQYAPEAVALARKLEKTKPNDLVDEVRKYGEHADYAGKFEGNGMFGEFPDPHTPRAAFNDAFGTKLPAVAEAPAPVSKVPKPSPEFISATQPEPVPAATQPEPAPRPRVPGVPAGQEALDALERGRAATRAKFATADVLKKLPGNGAEGRQVYDRQLWAKDAGVEQLKTLAEQTPGEIPKVARAYLEELFGKATSEGDFKHADWMYSQWRNLGDETKRILYPNPLMREHLDHFFLLAKKSGEKVNPSGSALVGGIVATVGYVLKNPISGLATAIPSAAVASMLHSPAGVAALTEGLRVSYSNPIAAKMTAARILKLAGSAANQVVPADSPTAGMIQ